MYSAKSSPLNDGFLSVITFSLPNKFVATSIASLFDTYSLINGDV